MNETSFSGLFIAEGTSDHPLSNIVETLFFTKGVEIRLSTPDFSLLSEKVNKDIKSKVEAGVKLIGSVPDVIVIHRDADNSGTLARIKEIDLGTRHLLNLTKVVPIIPVKMTEAWLLLDEKSIRTVSGNPKGKVSINIPKVREVESIANPKSFLAECILTASELTGRKRETLKKRFNQNRRQLLGKLDQEGPVTSLPSWQNLLKSVEKAAFELKEGH